MESILLIVPCIQYGGTETVAVRYYEELKKYNKNATILSIVSSSNLPDSASFIFHENSFIYKTLTINFLRPIFYIFVLISFLRYIKKNKIIIAFGELPIICSFPYAFFLSYFWKNNKKKFVCSFRNHPSTLNSFKINFLIYLMKYFDLITSNSIAAKKIFNKKIKPKKSIVLFNPMPSKEKIIPLKLLKKEGVLNMLSVSRLEKQKNIFLLVKTFHNILENYNKFNHFILHIVGDGSEYAKLKNYVNENNLNKNIIFYGKLSQTEVFHIFRYCDLFVHFSNWDGIPNTVLEALYLELPVLAYLSEKSGISDLAKFGAPISFFHKINAKQFFNEIIKIQESDYYQKFLYKNKKFIEKYRRKSSILNLLRLLK